MDVHLHHHQTRFRYEHMFPLLWLYALLLAAVDFAMDSPAEILHGLRRIILCEDALITDYILIGGPGAAFVNAALVTAVSICVLYLADDVSNGTTLVVIGLMSGFSLFGKNFLSTSGPSCWAPGCTPATTGSPSAASPPSALWPPPCPPSSAALPWTAAGPTPSPRWLPEWSSAL